MIKYLWKSNSKYKQNCFTLLLCFFTRLMVIQTESTMWFGSRKLKHYTVAQMTNILLNGMSLQQNLDSKYIEM